MSQPTCASPPTATTRSTGERRVEGTPGPHARPDLRRRVALGAALAVVGVLLYAVQGVATVASAADVDAAGVTRVLVVWGASAVPLALAFAVCSRLLPLVVTVAALSIAECIGIGAFIGVGSLAWWSALAIAPMLVVTAASVVASVGIVRDRPALSATAQLLAVVAAVGQAVLVTVGPVASAAVLDASAFLLATAPPIVAGIVAACLAALMHRGPRLMGAAGVALVVLACTMLVEPIASAVRGTAPASGVAIVVALRFLLVAGGGALLLASVWRGSRSRRVATLAA